MTTADCLTNIARTTTWPSLKEKKLKREFEVFGAIKKVHMVYDKKDCVRHATDRLCAVDILCAEMRGLPHMNLA